MARLTVALLSLALLAMPLAAGAQPAAKVPRIGVLWFASPTGVGAPAVREALQLGLRELGWIDGKTIALEHRYAEGQADRLPGLAAELVQLQVDVIVAAGRNPIAEAAKGATTSIPIVMVTPHGPEKSGLVASLARPGGNLTGLTFDAGPGIASRRLQLLKDCVPRLSRAAVLWNVANADLEAHWVEMREAARVLGLTLQIVGVRAGGDFPAAFAAISGQRAEALFVHGDALTGMYSRDILDFARRQRLPTMGSNGEAVRAGALISYSPSLREQFRRAAYFVDRLLKGARAAELPVEQPAKFELVVNLKAAREIGLTVPQSVLRDADEVIR
jgi:putative ABC transport system substrate-binding protein